MQPAAHEALCNPANKTHKFISVSINVISIKSTHRLHLFRLESGTFHRRRFAVDLTIVTDELRHFFSGGDDDKHFADQFQRRRQWQLRLIFQPLPTGFRPLPPIECCLSPQLNIKQLR